MPEKNRSGTDKQARYEDLAGVLMAVSVIAKKLARKLMAIAREMEEGGKTDDNNG